MSPLTVLLRLICAWQNRVRLSLAISVEIKDCGILPRVQGLLGVPQVVSSVLNAFAEHSDFVEPFSGRLGGQDSEVGEVSTSTSSITEESNVVSIEGDGSLSLNDAVDVRCRKCACRCDDNLHVVPRSTC